MQCVIAINVASPRVKYFMYITIFSNENRVVVVLIGPCPRHRYCYTLRVEPGLKMPKFGQKLIPDFELEPRIIFETRFLPINRNITQIELGF